MTDDKEKDILLSIADPDAFEKRKVMPKEEAKVEEEKPFTSRTKIVCTIGDNSESVEALKGLLLAGM